jgi:hypothetical protein
MRVPYGNFTGRRQSIQSSTGAILARGDGGMLPLTLEQPHAFEAAERAVQRAVRGEPAPLVFITQAFGDFVSVKLSDAAAVKRRRTAADSGF